MAWWEVGGGGAGGADAAVLRWVLAHRSGAVTPVARLLTYSGTSPLLYPVVIAAGVAVRLRTGWWGPGVAAIAVVVTGVLFRLGLSRLVRDPRPPRADWCPRPGSVSRPGTR